MKAKLLFIIIIFICTYGWAYSQECEIRDFNIMHYKGHTFLWLSEFQILHDPDCQCSLMWEGYIERINGVPKVILFRKHMMDYD